MTPFLSLPPASSALTNNVSPFPSPFRACHAGYFDHATQSHHGDQGPITLPRGWHFCIGSDSNDSEYRYQIMQRDREMSRNSLAVKKILVAFKTSTIVFNITNKMSVNCWLLIYQLTSNFLAKYQLTTIFLANCQLTTNPISTLLLSSVLRRSFEHRPHGNPSLMF